MGDGRRDVWNDEHGHESLVLYLHPSLYIKNEFYLPLQNSYQNIKHSINNKMKKKMPNRMNKKILRAFEETNFVKEYKSFFFLEEKHKKEHKKIF